MLVTVNVLALTMPLLAALVPTIWTKSPALTAPQLLPLNVVAALVVTYVSLTLSDSAGHVPITPMTEPLNVTGAGAGAGADAVMVIFVAVTTLLSAGFVPTTWIEAPALTSPQLPPVNVVAELAIT